MNENSYLVQSNKELILYLENELLKNHDDKSKRFVYFVYNQLTNTRDDYVEIHSRTIDKIFRQERYKERITTLIHENIIECDNSYIVDKKAKGYRLTDDFYDKTRLKKIYFTKDQYSTKTLKKVPVRKLKIKKSESGNRYNQVIVDALSSMRGLVNYHALLDFERELEGFIQRLRKVVTPGQYGYFKRLQRQIDAVKIYLNQQGFNEESNEFELYFKVSSSGRIFGNFQNKSKKIKHMLYSKFYNYDISNSQINILLNLLKQHGLKHDLFQEYVEDKKQREVIATRAGVTVKQWKQAIFTILFGGVVTDHPSSTFFKTIQEQMPFEIADSDFKWQEKFGKDLTAKVKEELQPYKEELYGWTDYLKNTFIPTHTKFNNKKEPYIANCLGRNLFYDKLESNAGDIIKRKKDNTLKMVVVNRLSAHIIQGIESSFIFHVTNLTTDIDNNTVVSNDFDGICCTGAISDKVIELAREKSGFYNAEFLLKPIDEEFDEFMDDARKRMKSKRQVISQIK
jgi:hypothetical protein